MIIKNSVNDNLGPMESAAVKDASQHNNAVESLRRIQDSYSYHGIDYIKDNYESVFKLIMDVLDDNSLNSRRIALEFAAEIIPCFESGTYPEDEITRMVMPKVVSNLGNSSSVIKKATVQTLNVYMKHFNRGTDVLRVIIKQLESEDPKTRTELMVALPVVITPTFAEEDLLDLISALVHRLELSSIKAEHNPPSLVCLERLKSTLGEQVFTSYIDRLSQRLQKEYSSSLQKSAHISQDDADIEMQNSFNSSNVKKSLSSISMQSTSSGTMAKKKNSIHSPKDKPLAKSTTSLDKSAVKPVNSAEKIGLIRARSTERLTKPRSYSERAKKSDSTETLTKEEQTSSARQTLYYGFIPSDTIADLEDNNWRTRANGIEKLKALIENITDTTVLLSNLGDFLEILTRFVDDANFKILLTSLYILREVLDKVGENIRPHMEVILMVVQTRLGDSKTIVKQLNMQIVLRMMHFAKPWVVLQSLMPFISHRNSKIREDVVNIITAALLTFPSSDFKLASLPSLVSHLLVDPKRRVRQAVLECFAVIAQGLGPGRMQPLVSSVDMVELNTNGEGVMEAVQARLARRKLPKLTADGTLEYSVVISNATKSQASSSPDISWILYGSAHGAENGKNIGDGGSKRYCSAGKKRLPWENGELIDASSPLRKSVGSAPLRSQEEKLHSPPSNEARNSWAPGRNPSYLEKYHVKAKLGMMPLKQENFDQGKNDGNGSYFHMYKQRMRKLKQAGLQADHNMVNDLSRASPLSAIDSMRSKGPVVRRNSIGKESKHTPSILSPVRATDTSPVPPFEDKQLSASWSGSELIENQMWQLAKKPTDLVPLSNGDAEHGPERDSESPIHVKPTLARSASKKRRQLHIEPGRTSPNIQNAIEKQERQKNQAVDPLVAVRQQVAVLRKQKQEDEGQKQDFSSPFDSRPRIARSPSAHKIKSRIQSSDKLSSDTSDSSSPRDADSRTNEDGKGSPNEEHVFMDTDSNKVFKSIHNNSNDLNNNERANRRRDQETNNSYEAEKRTGSSDVFMARKSTVAVTTVKEITGVSDEQNAENTKMESLRDWKKANSGLSKSALDRMEKRKSEEIRKRELAAIKLREKEIEERLRIEKEARDAEERKQTHLAQTMAEMKRLEDLIKAEERRREEEAREKRRLEEEARRKRELQLQREQNAKQDEEEMRRAEEQMKNKDMKRREERMKELEDLIKIEEKRQEDIRKMKDNMRKEKEQRQEEELRQQREEEELKRQAEEEARRKAEIELAETRRRKAELRRIKEQQLKQELEAKQKEEVDKIASNMVADSIEASNQGDDSKRVEAFEVNFGKCDQRGNSLLGNDLTDGGREDFVEPTASRSPKIKRKFDKSVDGRAHSDVQFSNHTNSANGVNRASTEGEISSDQVHPFDNPDQALRDALRNIAASSEDWEAKCQGLQSIRRLVMHHQDVMALHIHQVVLAVSSEVRNLRSQVSRSAITCLGDVCMYLPKQVEPELELAVNTLLSKAGESNTFIKEDVEQSLSSIVRYVNSVKTMGALISGGAGHRNGQVRKMCSRFLVPVAEKIGCAKLLSGSKDITERILPAAAQFAVDGQQDTRYYGRCILYLMIEHPDLDKRLEKHLPKANLRPARDIVENLRNKGLGDAPNEHGSAALRRSTRNSGVGASHNPNGRSTTFSGSRANTDTRQGSGAKVSVRSSVNRTTRQTSQVDGYQPARPLDLESISGLASNEWKARAEAIENLYEMVRTNSDGVASHVNKVFDNFIPRLTDSNSKVNLQALQTMNKIVPILRDSLAPLITMLMQSLTSCVASKNNSIYHAAMEVLVSLTKFVDNVMLLQPLIAAVKFGNARVKPEMAMRLADLVTPIFQRKPNMIQTHILPVLWHLLSTSKAGSAANSRNDLNTATAKLCEELYICYGESLYEEAENQGRNVLDKLRYYMM